MTREEMKKICEEEFKNNINEYFNSGTIFAYIKELEDKNQKQQEVLDKIKPMLKELNIKIKDILNIGIDIKEISDILELLEEIE